MKMEVLFARAVEHHRAGRLDEANRDYQAVLASEPRHAPSWHLMGALAVQRGEIGGAIEMFETAIALDPAMPAYFNDLGEALRLSRQPGKAAICYRKALALDPTYVAAHNNLGIAEFAQGRHAKAIGHYRRALALNRNFAPAYLNLAVALVETAQIEAAEAAFETARQLDPANPGLMLNMANLWQVQNRLDDAIGVYRRLLETDPSHVEAMVNLGDALRRQGRPDAALEQFDAALALIPDLPAARWNAGLCHLLLGDLTRGWAGFAWRFKAGAVMPAGPDGPEWTGDVLNGRRVAVLHEQGLGDSIQFARYLKKLKPAGADEVILRCPKPLVRLLSGLCRTVADDAPIPAWDCRIALPDLPRLFSTTLATIDGAVPYIKVAPERASLWRDRLAALPAPRIGLVWRGRSDHKNDRNRSMPAAAMAPLTHSPAGWVSLQQGATDGEQAALGPVLHLGDAFGDLLDAAEAIAALDLVITVDTALAHLAGALGKPVWILLPMAPDWRWMTGRSDSPWYPTARLFRQSRIGDWGGVIRDVAEALGGFNASASED
ncbi:MAG: tetratricopeptide repeat protein [Aliidongia sp.]